jgi:hypothetical protein
VKYVETRHHLRPPAVLVYSAIVAPCSKRTLWPSLRTPRGPLTHQQLVEVEPLPLFGRKQRQAVAPQKVLDDDREEERQDEDATDEVVEHEEEGVELRRVLLWLLVLADNGHAGLHHVDPSFERNDLEQNQQRLAERVECPHLRVLPDAGREEIRLHRRGRVLSYALQFVGYRRVVAAIQKTREDVQTPHGVWDNVEDCENRSVT